MSNPITPQAIYELVSASDPTLSPDGSTLAFVKSWVDREAMEGRSRVMVLDLEDGRLREFTQGKGDSRPHWSPDGSLLAFIRPDEKGRRQLWVMPARGGEARRVTDEPGGVWDFAWSPDCRSLAYVSDVDPDRPPENHDPKKDPRVRVVRRFRYRFDTLGWRGDAHRHIFVVDLESGRSRQLTDGDWDDGAPAWSPDGSHIAFISARRPDRELLPYNEAYVIPAGGGRPRLLSQGLYSVASITWSPKGDGVVVIGSDDPEAGATWQGYLFLLKPGQEPQRLTDDSIRPVAGYPPVVPSPELRWTHDGRLLFLADVRGASSLYALSLSDGALRRVAGGTVAATAMAADAEGRRAVVVTVAPDSAGRLELVDVTSGQAQVLVDYNQDYLEGHPPAKLEKFSFWRAGVEVEARLWLPPDMEPGRRYPLVLDIHGGPHGVFYDAFNIVQQVLATAGYVVLAVNPRGSSTYGADFMKAVLRDWGGEDYLDLMEAVDRACRLPYVDPERLGVHGYSYGGFMTSWIVGHTDRFKAAVVGAPVTDLPSFAGTSDIGVSFGEVQMGGPRHELLQEYIRRSPITYAPNVKTPVLLLHGEADYRCPIEQSEQYFVALKRLGKEVEFVRFPDSSHLFLRMGHPRLREEYLARTLSWFDRHLRAAETVRREVRAAADS